MAGIETAPKQAPLSLDSEILEEASTIATSDQPGMLGRTDQSVPIPSATEANSPGAEIHPVDVASSNDAILPNGASSSTPDDSQGVGGEQEDEQNTTSDDPSNPSIAPRYGTDALIKLVDYEKYEPPPPPRPSWIQCICCCFLTVYYIHYARKIRNFKYIPHGLIALMVIPFSAVYFGASYTGYCPLSPAAPLLLILAGIVGAVLLVVRATFVNERVSGTRPRNAEKTFDAVTLGVGIMLMLIMTAEMFVFYKMYPNFDDTNDPDFCPKEFYDYLNYMNFAIMVLGILGLLLHIPMKPSDPVQVVPLEYFETI